MPPFNPDYSPKPFSRPDVQAGGAPNLKPDAKGLYGLSYAPNGEQAPLRPTLQSSAQLAMEGNPVGDYRLAPGSPMMQARNAPAFQYQPGSVARSPMATPMLGNGSQPGPLAMKPAEVLNVRDIPGTGGPMRPTGPSGLLTGGAGAAEGLGSRAAGLAFRPIPILGDIAQGYAYGHETGSLGRGVAAGLGSLGGRVVGGLGGSVVPGPGTLVGETAGAIGGAYGAAKLYDAASSMFSGSHPPQAASAPVAQAPAMAAAPQPFAPTADDIARFNHLSGGDKYRQNRYNPKSAGDVASMRMLLGKTEVPSYVQKDNMAGDPVMNSRQASRYLSEHRPGSVAASPMAAPMSAPMSATGVAPEATNSPIRREYAGMTPDQVIAHYNEKYDKNPAPSAKVKGSRIEGMPSSEYWKKVAEDREQRADQEE